MEMGAAGATEQLQSIYKAYLKAGDAKESVYALRHAWRAQYDFGQLAADALDASSVLFTLSDYEGVGMVHGMMIVGWGVAAARVCGCTGARADVLERPWRGGERLRYRIHF